MTGERIEHMTDRWAAPRTGTYRVTPAGIYEVTHDTLPAVANDLPETTTVLPADAWVTDPTGGEK